MKRGNLVKNLLMQNRASETLRCLVDAPVVTVEPGLTVESRISHGVHGEDDDLALSVEWRDTEGCLWAANFTENALAKAEVDGEAILVRDVGGANVVFRLYEPSKQITLSSRENDC